MIPYLTACFLTPFMGYYMHYFHNRPLLILVSSFLYFITHLYYVILPECDKCASSTLPLVLLGVCFTTFATIIMPSIPIFLNNEAILGTGFGIVAIMQNLLLSIVPLISAELIEMNSNV